MYFKLFNKFRTSKYLIDVIEKIYNFKIELIVVKSTEVLAYNTSVKEGDNLGLILFIMIMPFISDIFPLKILVKNAMERQKV